MLRYLLSSDVTHRLREITTVSILLACTFVMLGINDPHTILGADATSYGCTDIKEHPTNKGGVDINQVAADDSLVTDHPNIVYILADDLGYGELSCYGQQRYETPHIDQLAERGMKFTQHYSGNPVCAPSRCSLMTGYHTGHTQIRGNKQIGGGENWTLGATGGGQYPITEDTVTVGHLLQDAGYKTGAIGKWGLGTTDSTGSPNLQGFDHYFGYICQRQAHTHYPNHLWRNDQIVSIPENEDGAEVSHSHELMTDEAIGFIDDNADGPFFLYMAYAIPHVSIQATPETMAQFKNRYEEPTPFEGSGLYIPQPTPRAGYAAMITMLDDAVGRIVAKLEEEGLDDDTLIIFTSDNGPTFNGGSDSFFFNSAGPFSGLKGSVYEGGIRIPMIAQWPDHIEAGSVNHHVSAFWDVLPTVAEIIDVETPEGIDGVSMLPSLMGRNDEQEEHELLYWELGTQQAIRMGDWKAIRRINRDANEPGPTELYNLSADPGELHDLAGQHPDMVDQMNRLFSESRTESDVFTMFR
jgi:arylsulfatase A